MEFGILGPLVVWRDGREVPIGAAKQRALVTLLLLRRGELVPTETLVDELWGEQPPATAVKAVQTYVSQLRKTLGEGLLETGPTGYRLRLEPDALDAVRFEHQLTRAQTLLAAGAVLEAAELLREALGIWRGPALVEFRYEAFARDEIGRLEGLRLIALEHRLEADLELGSARRSRVRAPTRSCVSIRCGRTRRLLMLALYLRRFWQAMRSRPIGMRALRSSKSSASTRPNHSNDSRQPSSATTPFSTFPTDPAPSPRPPADGADESRLDAGSSRHSQASFRWFGRGSLLRFLAAFGSARLIACRCGCSRSDQSQHE